MARRSHFSPVGRWSGSHCRRTSERATADAQSSWLPKAFASKDEGTACASRESKKRLFNRIARMTSCPSACPHWLRYIIQRKFGLIQLIREYLKSPPKRPLSTANCPIVGQ